MTQRSFSRHIKALSITCLWGMILLMTLFFLWDLKKTGPQTVSTDYNSDFLLISQDGKVFTKDHLRRKVTVFLMGLQSLEWAEFLSIPPKDKDIMLLGFNIPSTLCAPQGDWICLQNNPSQRKQIEDFFSSPLEKDDCILGILNQDVHFVYKNEDLSSLKDKQQIKQVLSQSIFNQKVYAYLQGRTFFGPKKS